MPKVKKNQRISLLKILKKKKIKYAILRYFNIVGANLKDKIGEYNNNDHVIKNFSKQIQNKIPVFKIYGKNYETKSGTCVRDYLHVKDLDYIHYKVFKLLNLKKYKSIIVNCGTSVGYSNFDLYKKFSKKANQSKLLIYQRRAGDVAIAVANIRFLKHITGKKYKFKNMDNIINDSIKWEKYLKKLSIKY